VRLEATRVLMFMPAEEALPPKVCTGGEMLVAAAGVQPLQRDFRTERFLMAEFTGNDTTKDATFRRLLRIVCGDGACSNPAVMQRVINALKHAEKTSLEGEHADTQHITRLSHSEVRNPPHRLCLISRPALGRRGVVRMSLALGKLAVRAWRQAERAALEALLHADAVLGPILEQLRCLITRGGELGVDCCYGRPEAQCVAAPAAASTTTHAARASHSHAPARCGSGPLGHHRIHAHTGCRKSSQPAQEQPLASNRHMPCPIQRTHARGLWVARWCPFSAKDPL
jgi:hypothetical protein